MGILTKLASQSAIYGLSSVVPRLLNYFLVVLHSRVFSQGEYGVITEIYAYVAMLLIVLTFGLETGFFRFADVNKPEESEKTYGSIFYFLLCSSALFLAASLLWTDGIAQAMGYSGNESFIRMTAAILAIDAFAAIVFDKLRWQGKALIFSGIKILSVIINVALNLIFLTGFSAWGWYAPSFNVGYVFLANLAGSCFSLAAALIMTGGLPKFGSLERLKPIMAFSFPLLISGLGGVVNEFLDRIFIKLLSPSNNPMDELGIYGANVKIAVLLVLFVQMFKFAAEPFFFAQAQGDNDPKVYAMVTKYFSYFTLLVMVGIIFYLPILQYFVGKEFRVGLGVVPILLIANTLYGFFFNTSFWYKIQKKTWYGALFTFSGAGVTVAVNLLLTPRLGYYGAAIARVCSYTAMIGMCLYIGQRHFPVPYEYGRIILATLASGLCIWLGMSLQMESTALLLIARSVLGIGLLYALMRLENTTAKQLYNRWIER